MRSKFSKKKPKNSKIKKHFDYIIIGSGLAGLNAALQASKRGTVLIITKKKLADCNTSYAQGGIAVVLAETDNFKKHFEDTLTAGSYHNDKKAVRFIIKNGPAAVRRLMDLGLKFSKNNEGKISLGREGGHQENRIAHIGDFSGKAIEETLIENIQKNPRITLLENIFAKDLLVQKNICYGVEIVHKNNIEHILGRKIILATGGLGQVYQKTTNPSVATGDGIAMADRAGCKVKDLEFIQFHPTAFLERKNPQFLLSEAIRGEGAILINAQGERFMSRYHRNGELAPRDVVSRAIFEEEKKGTVFLSLRKDWKVAELRKNLSRFNATRVSSPSGGRGLGMESKLTKKRFPQIFTYLQNHGYNLAKDLIPITPAAHFSCGGIQTNLKGETSIKHLYAFGEVACTGLHGANRLASNSLLEALVMSTEILQSPLPTIKKYPSFKIARDSAKESPNEKKKIAKIRHELQKIMWEKVGIIRNEKNLLVAQKEIDQLVNLLLAPASRFTTNLNFRKNLGFDNLNAVQSPNEGGRGLGMEKSHHNFKFSKDYSKKLSGEHWETLNMFQVALLIIKAALKRKKSLGAHFIEKTKNSSFSGLVKAKQQ